MVCGDLWKQRVIELKFCVMEIIKGSITLNELLNNAEKVDREVTLNFFTYSNFQANMLKKRTD